MIARFFAPLALTEGAYGLTDDAATVRVPKGHELVVTADAIVEGVHFLKIDPPDTVAKKALRVNLSDLAAKGAAPLGYLLTLCLPRRIDDRWLAAFAHGLTNDQKMFGISLLGGDTTATPGPLTIAITALGSIRTGRMTRRAGAKEGDLIFVSGTIGDAGVGLAVLPGANRRLSAGHRDALVARYRTPEPRLVLGRALVGIASAAVDVSDGLIADLAHIAENSTGAFTIDASRLPLSPAYLTTAGSNDIARVRAATSGDDYEIAFTAPARARRRVMAAARRARTLVTEIGRVEEGRGVFLLDAKGHPLPTGKGGYVHF